MLQQQAATYAKQISDLLQRLPPPLLLLLKTNDCLRSVDMSLGQPVNTLVITARECTRALAELEVRAACLPAGPGLLLRRVWVRVQCMGRSGGWPSARQRRWGCWYDWGVGGSAVQPAARRGWGTASAGERCLPGRQAGVHGA